MDSVTVETLPCLCGHQTHSLSFASNKLLSGSLGAKIVTCDSCGLMRTTPRPLTQTSSEEELYQDEDYFAGARLNSALWYEMQKPIIRDVKKFKPSGTWLDIGSGLGFLPKVATDHGYHARGIDLNASVVSEGQRTFGHPVSVTTLDEIEDQSVDIISINHVLEHVEVPSEFLELAASKLKEDGIIIVGVPNIKGGIPRIIRFINTLGMKRGSAWLWHGYQLKQHLWHFTPESVKTVLPKSLTIKKINQSDNMYYGFLGINKFRYKVLAFIFSLFKHIELGDNLRVVLVKNHHE